MDVIFVHNSEGWGIVSSSFVRSRAFRDHSRDTDNSTIELNALGIVLHHNQLQSRLHTLRQQECQDLTTPHGPDIALGRTSPPTNEPFALGGDHRQGQRVLI
jgi:hypothetical protein